MLAVRGTVVERSPETVNPKMATGEIEVHREMLVVLNEAKTPPFPIQDDLDVEESIRLKYRYLDLRRPGCKRTLHAPPPGDAGGPLAFSTEHGFMEVETPMLTRSTPEGARDYLVPEPGADGESSTPFPNRRRFSNSC